MEWGRKEEAFAAVDDQRGLSVSFCLFLSLSPLRAWKQCYYSTNQHT